MLNAPTTTIDGREVIAFAGTNYLGLARDQRVIAAAAEAVRIYGVSSSASRVTTGTVAPHTALEEATASFFDTEASVSLPAGFLSNLAVVEALEDDVDCWFYDERAHASIVTALKLASGPVTAYAHRDSADLRRRIADRRGRCAVFTDALFGVDGAVAPLPALLDAIGTAGTLIVDEAHSAGVLGATGRGLFEHDDVAVAESIRTGVFSKAFGAHGGFVAGPEALCDRIRAGSHVYQTSTALPPALAAAAAASLAIIRAEPARLERLRDNIARMSASCQHLGLVTNDATPIFTLDPARVADARTVHRHCLEHGVWVPHFVYPGGPPGGLVRWTVQTDHRPEHIDALANALRA